MYPESQYANVNSAALDIENGAYDVALNRLAKIDTPESWNNMGVAYQYKEEYEKAREYFQRAADAGNAMAQQNLTNLNEWMQAQ